MDTMTDTTAHEDTEPAHGDMLAVFTILDPVDVEWRYSLGHSEDKQASITSRIDDAQSWLGAMADLVDTLINKGAASTELRYTGLVERFEDHTTAPGWYTIGEMHHPDDEKATKPAASA